MLFYGLVTRFMRFKVISVFNCFVISICVLVVLECNNRFLLMMRRLIQFFILRFFSILNLWLLFLFLQSRRLMRFFKILILFRLVIILLVFNFLNPSFRHVIGGVLI